ncbi:MAG: hypothetical protein OEY75_05785, partial [Hylemonella sp.]|nr:hypothetical protein [Hylemonella sp.]
AAKLGHADKVFELFQIHKVSDMAWIRLCRIAIPARNHQGFARGLALATIGGSMPAALFVE